MTPREMRTLGARRRLHLVLLLHYVAIADSDFVTCGSLVKLTHVESSYQLHSHDITYGAGSKQQSVTATQNHDDRGNLWMVKEAYGASPCKTGEPVSCNTEIRLEHVATERNLHTHKVQSPLSRQQEISCFDKRDDGDGNDDWRVSCTTKSEAMWSRGQPVRFVSAGTGALLHSHSQHRFTDQNCPRCPIIGQQEITGFTEVNPQNLWVASGGVYFATEA